ncbi:MAG: TRAM domain-containing protein [Deltaproteobacteria bacterium]|nr:TRAM domain-containing protein [Deltaproteobacteria bacterium]MBN2845936.1 TRAM domain-containing protein [Deltaproteobacteria bacterium]
MFQFIIRLLLIAACSVSAYFITLEYYDFPYSLIGLAVGFFVALLVIQIERSIRNVSLRVISGGVIGTIIGFFIAVLFVFGLRCIPGWEKQELIPWEYVYIILTLILGYLGLFLGSKKSREAGVYLAGARKKDSGESRDYRILDTSVIIDGRIADISDTGFIHGDLIVPRFVLDELQQIADSSDHMKRSRGRRGLDILNRMQKSEGIHIDIVDSDFPKIKGVDAKLIALAKKEEGKIITNDYNLNKVAELQGINILNVNELANALKPVVLPGETMVVKVIKEGKEQGQGVAYLDDGTMVIVDSGSNFIGKTVQVVVTSVLQTTAGRMIFSNMKESNAANK